MGHAAPLQDVAAGVRALPGAADAFAATQAAWRFYNNDATTLPALAGPLLQVADAAVATHTAEVALVACDWCQLHYRAHTRKADRVALTNRYDPGYELHTALLLSDRDGEPVAPVHVSLRTADGLLLSSQDGARKVTGTKLDRLTAVFDFVEGRAWGKPRVYIIDREADSVDHYRRWDRRGLWFVVRADDNRRVVHDGREVLLPAVHARLRAAGAFRFSRDVSYRGRAAKQYVGEATVCLARPGKASHGRVSKPGAALTLRLIVAEVRDDQGEVLAHWLLLTNAPPAFAPETVALWYYWRWRIESYFKLLKSAGQEVEHWQQETGPAVAKRLLVASMACVLAWKVGRSVHPSAASLRAVLIRLSGRQMKWGVEYTEPALLAGLWVVMQSLAVLEMFDAGHLRDLLRGVLLDPERPPESSALPPPRAAPKHDV